jgi:hypothetical protein
MHRSGSTRLVVIGADVDHGDVRGQSAGFRVFFGAPCSGFRAMGIFGSRPCASGSGRLSAACSSAGFP